jgi:hypothetical protein
VNNELINLIYKIVYIINVIENFKIWRNFLNCVSFILLFLGTSLHL